MKRYLNRFLFITFFIPALLIPVSCSMRQKIFMEIDGSGTADIRIEVSKVFSDYIKDLAEVTGTLMEDGIFNIEEIEKELAANEKIELKRIQTPGPDTLEMTIAFPGIEELFSNQTGLEEAGVLSFSSEGGKYNLRIHIDRSNFTQIYEAFPMLKNPFFEGFGPQEGDTISEEEYLELIELAMGEEGAVALKASFLELHVKVKGRLIWQSGGTLDKDGVVFRIPLIRLALLNKSLDYSVSFK